MNALAPLLPLDAVCVDSPAQSRKRLFEEAALMMERRAGVAHNEAFDALFAREKIGTTCVGHGCGIPHGRLASLDAPLLTIIRTLEPIALDAADEEPVRLFVCLLVPDNDSNQYLTILREAAALLSDDAMREQLLAAPDAQTICELVHGWVPPESLHPSEDKPLTAGE